MSSPDAQDSGVPDPTVLARKDDDGQDAVDAVAAAVADLDQIEDLPVAEHVRRFEAAHTALTDALAKADNLQAGTNANRS
ncbi:hypothetical protein IQ251_15965 [Saccharopolyspora sp. HNM0983]|uniref:Uncharacterized protein n=1 Tax=Saccharopolyspora montiporae TaxID=2781240 RepID=A0A929B9V0_9PSEU|nr:hypothetical protein [Saccharopolyspora sp. HNM0983]MBE9375947.1 hypothetical protein [Saccharopolyspora sp. HNM0983]